MAPSRKLLLAVLAALLAVGILYTAFILTRPADSPECPTCGTMTVQVFFLNDRLDPGITCTKVFPVERTVPKSPAVARAALEALLAGPTEAERAEGWGTALPAGVGIRSLSIASGTAYADFSDELDKGIGGSCRVSAIRAQIETTLTRFSTVERAVLSIGGRTEDILQP